MRWWPIANLEVFVVSDGLVPDAAWRAQGEFRWQLVHWVGRNVRPEPPQHPGRFELTCFALGNLGGWNACYSSLPEAHREVNRVEQLAATRRRILGGPGSADVVLWPETWEIITTSMEITDHWVCPACETTLPAYKIETAKGREEFWICPSCSMPLDWRDSPERLRLSEVDLTRLEAMDLEMELGLGVTALEDRQFFIEDDLEASAVHALRLAWLPPAPATRTILCCELEDDGHPRWLIFVVNQEQLAILVEASESDGSYLGYYVEFGDPLERLRLIGRWDCRVGWVDQLPDPQVFWLEDGTIRKDPGADTDRIKSLLFPEQEQGPN